MDPRIIEYLKRKQEAQDQYNQSAETINDSSLFSNLGDVIAGQRVGSGNPYFDKQRDLAKEQSIGDLDKQQKYLLDQDKLQSDREKAKAILDAQLQSRLDTNKFRNQSLDLQKQKLEQNRIEQGLKSKERSTKEKELSSAQAKQLGLAQMGQTANTQYETAIQKGKDNKEFDPTSYGDIIDSSDWAPNWMKSGAAKEARSAQDAWIESYLRDASGAAIPPSERSAYARDYFPRPGDTPEVVANKQALRAQKEESALIGAGPGAEKFKKPVDRKQIGGKWYKKVPGGWAKE